MNKSVTMLGRWATVQPDGNNFGPIFGHEQQHENLSSCKKITKVDYHLLSISKSDIKISKL